MGRGIGRSRIIAVRTVLWGARSAPEYAADRAAEFAAPTNALRALVPGGFAPSLHSALSRTAEPLK